MQIWLCYPKQKRGTGFIGSNTAPTRSSCLPKKWEDSSGSLLAEAALFYLNWLRNCNQIRKVATAKTVTLIVTLIVNIPITSLRSADFVCLGRRPACITHCRMRQAGCQKNKNAVLALWNQYRAA